MARVEAYEKERGLFRIDATDGGSRRGHSELDLRPARYRTDPHTTSDRVERHPLNGGGKGRLNLQNSQPDRNAR